MRAGRGPRLRGDVRVWTFAVFSLLVGEGSSAIGSARFPLLARGVGARVGGWMLLRCMVGVEGVGGGMLGFVRLGGAGRAACVGPVSMLVIPTPMFSYLPRSHSRVSPRYFIFAEIACLSSSVCALSRHPFKIEHMHIDRVSFVRDHLLLSLTKHGVRCVL